MSEIDAALVVLLLLCALRGFWRGFLRECFGFAGLVLGLAVAMRFAGAASSLLTERVPMPTTAVADRSRRRRTRFLSRPPWVPLIRDW